MALSQTESEQLLDAIGRLNVSTETIQDVLDLIRNAGHSGAVDISEHNNDPHAHDSNTNIMQKDADGKVRIPTVTLTSKGASYPSVAIGRETTLSTRVLGSSLGTFLETCDLDDWSVPMARGLYPRVVSVDHTTKQLKKISPYTSMFSISPSIIQEGSTSLFSGNLGATMGFYADDINHGANGKEGSMILTLYSDSSVYPSPQPIALKVTPRFICGSVEGTSDLGQAAYPFKDAYLENAPTITSDMREKTDITPLQESSCIGLIKGLKPSSFKMKQGDVKVLKTDDDGNVIESEVIAGTRTHYGFIAQEVKETLTSTGISDAALWAMADKDDANSKQMLRYEEMIAPMVAVIQSLLKRVEELEGK